MTLDDIPPRVHVVVGSPWRETVLALLGAPLQPWSAAHAETGEGVLVLIDSAPRMVLTEVLGADDFCSERPREAVAVSDIEAELGWALPVGGVVDGDRVGPLLETLQRWRWDTARTLFGHSTGAAAHTLLASNARCAGCDTDLDLTTAFAGDLVSVWTAEDRETDWPATLCVTCRRLMTDEGFSSFLGYRFSRHPRCPRCGGGRSALNAFGMPVYPLPYEPWVNHQGCCVTAERWTCTLCRHQW